MDLTTKTKTCTLDAGYTPVPNLNDEKKVGIYGKKATLFTATIIFLTIITVINLGILILLVIHLRMNIYGLSTYSYSSNHKMNVFKKNLINPYLKSNRLSSFQHENLDFELIKTNNNVSTLIQLSSNLSSIQADGQKNSVLLKANKFKLSNELDLLNVDQLKRFLTDNQLNTKHFNARTVRTSKIKPTDNSDTLKLQSPTSLHIQSYKKTEIKDAHIEIINPDEIQLQTTNKDDHDVFLIDSSEIKFESIPIIMDNHNLTSTTDFTTTATTKKSHKLNDAKKLCICRNNKRVYVLNLRTDRNLTCAHIKDASTCLK